MDTALAQINSGAVIAGMGRLQTLVAEKRRQLSGRQWEQFIQSEVRTHPVLNVVHEDPFTYRAFSKPRGYAGDAVMMDYIYGYRTAEVDALSERSRRVFNYTIHTAPPEAVRFRRRIVAEMIDTETVRLGRDIEVVAIAAGHLREADLSSAVRGGRARMTALDQDEEGLALVTRDYARYGVDAVATSVRRIIAGRTKLPAADVSYTVGLYDYLPPAAAVRLTSIMFDALRPGGTLLVANFLPDILGIGYMESLMDWRLIYRSDEEMRQLITAVPVGEIASVSQFHDPFDNITFLRVSKAGGGRGVGTDDEPDE